MNNQLIENHYKQNYARHIKRMTFRAGGVHQAEDIVQEAYLRALKYYDSTRIDEFDKWFSMVLNNSYNDYMRDEIGLSYIDDDDEPLGSIDCSILGAQTLIEIYDLINTKSVSQVEILMLHLKQGYSATDISKQTEYSYAQIHKCIQRFKKELKDLYV